MVCGDADNIVPLPKPRTPMVTVISSCLDTSMQDRDLGCFQAGPGGGFGPGLVSLLTQLFLISTY